MVFAKKKKQPQQQQQQGQNRNRGKKQSKKAVEEVVEESDISSEESEDEEEEVHLVANQQDQEQNQNPNQIQPQQQVQQAQQQGGGIHKAQGQGVVLNGVAGSGLGIKMMDVYNPSSVFDVSHYDYLNGHGHGVQPGIGNHHSHPAAAAMMMGQGGMQMQLDGNGMQMQMQVSHSSGSQQQGNKKRRRKYTYQCREVSSFKIFNQFVKRFENGPCDASGILSLDCYTKWLDSRRKLPKKPQEAFRRALTAHCRGVDGRRPFAPEVEEDLLRELRKKKQWACFQHLDNCGSIGVQGFPSLGYHEKLKLQQQKNGANGKQPQTPSSDQDITDRVQSLNGTPATQLTMSHVPQHQMHQQPPIAMQMKPNMFFDYNHMNYAPPGYQPYHGYGQLYGYGPNMGAGHPADTIFGDILNNYNGLHGGYNVNMLAGNFLQPHQGGPHPAMFAQQPQKLVKKPSYVKSEEDAEVEKINSDVNDEDEDEKQSNATPSNKRRFSALMTSSLLGDKFDF